ncbi:hypothetical protein J5X84_35170 [Streptosporangiaceae bacterium NEAU-GS5]|nr:hypothetical protein [Streptosporangiaceae bacterium NEAU-GS5]
MSDIPAASRLARRLRDLRTNHWPDTRLTQADLSKAFGASIPLISSWEARQGAAVPPVRRLEAYATFFATRRSVEEGDPRLLRDNDLTRDEHAERERLLKELKSLRAAVQLAQADVPRFAAPAAASMSQGPWYFPDGKPIMIVCSSLPLEMRAQISYADPESPDYTALYKYADLDSLLELWGHLRAANPGSKIRYKAPEDLEEDDLTDHLALLGGVDWNTVTASVVEPLDLPIQQVADWAGEKGPYFQIAGEDRHHPVVLKEAERQKLIEDVALFFRGVNPFNTKRTVTICNAMYARGVYGSVRALTDERFRDRNSEYLEHRFGGLTSYGILSRVKLVGPLVNTPDWTRDGMRLYEWPETVSED